MLAKFSDFVNSDDCIGKITSKSIRLQSLVLRREFLMFYWFKIYAFLLPTKSVKLLVITTLITVDFFLFLTSFFFEYSWLRVVTFDISLTPLTQLLNGTIRCIEIFRNFNFTILDNSNSLLLTLIIKYSNKRLGIRSLIQVKYQLVKFIFNVYF